MHAVVIYVYQYTAAETVNGRRLGYRLIKMSSNLVHHVTRMSSNLHVYFITSLLQNVI